MCSTGIRLFQGGKVESDKLFTEPALLSYTRAMVPPLKLRLNSVQLMGSTSEMLNFERCSAD